MPFKQYQSTLDPEALRILQEAFNQTLAEVVAVPGTSVDEQSARDIIAKRIVQAALNDGERDLDRLKRYALQAFQP